MSPKKGQITSAATRLVKAVEAYQQVEKDKAQLDIIIRSYWRTRLMLLLAHHSFFRAWRDLKAIEPTWYGT
jgi:hypothetical protein